MLAAEVVSNLDRRQAGLVEDRLDRLEERVRR